MRLRLGTLLCALAVLQISGAHWALLQSTAWIGMLVQNAERVGWKDGLRQTFDGDHPCPVCLAIKAGKRHEEKKTASLQAEQRMFFLAPWSRFQAEPGAQAVAYPPLTARWAWLTDEPPVPPPRA